MDGRTTAIEVQHLAKAYQGVRVLDDVSFAVGRGTVFALLGANGSGKTTTINILTTLIRADGGTASALTDTWTMTKRSLRHTTRSLDTIITVVLTPIAMLLLFVYVFGGALGEQTGATDYIDFITPGVIVMTVTSGIAYAAVRLSADLQNGIISRFRTMPVAPSSVLSGQALSSTLSNLVSCVLVVTVARSSSGSARRRTPSPGSGSASCSSSSPWPSPGWPCSSASSRRPSRAQGPSATSCCC
jgi:energy-coupling factor transporter ATP-binding protein EcfA2